MFPSPFEFWRPAMQMARIAVESQTIVALRLTGMAGLWPMAPVETFRMVTEKIDAGHASALAAFQASLSGKGPATVAMAALRPVRRHTRANAKRLRAGASKGAE